MVNFSKSPEKKKEACGLTMTGRLDCKDAERPAEPPQIIITTTNQGTPLKPNARYTRIMPHYYPHLL